MARPNYNRYMPLNLQKPMVDEFWERQDMTTQTVLNWMKSAEHWTMDGKPQLEGPLRRLAEVLENVPAQRLHEASVPMIRAMAYLSTPAALRLLEWMDERHGMAQRGATRGPDMDLVGELLQSASRLRIAGEQSHSGPQRTPGAIEGAVLLDRLQTLKSISLLRNIFKRDRVFHLTQMLEDIQQGR